MRKMCLKVMVVITLVLFMYTGCDTVKDLIPEPPSGIPSFNDILSEAGMFLNTEVLPRVENELRKIVNEHISDEYQYLILIMRTIGTTLENDKALLFSRDGRLPVGYKLTINDVESTIRTETIQGIEITYVNHSFKEGTEYKFQIISGDDVSTLTLKTPDNLSVVVFPETLPLAEPFRLEWEIANEPKVQFVTTANLNTTGGIDGSFDTQRVTGESHVYLPAGFGRGWAIIRVDAATYEENDGILAVAFTDSWKPINLPIPTNYDYMLTIIENLDIPMWDVSHRIMFAGRSGISVADLTLKVNGVELQRQTIPLLAGTYFNYNFEKGEQYVLEASAGGKTSRVLLTIPRNLSVNNWPANFNNTEVLDLKWANSGARHQVYTSWIFTDRLKNELSFTALDSSAETHTVGGGNRAHIAFMRIDAMNFSDRNGFVFLGTSTSWKAYQNVLDIGFNIDSIKIW